MNEIFISYSRKDKAFAQKLAEALINTARDPWVDWEDIPLTADWWAEIQRGIEGAHTFIFIISPDSVASSVCAQEVEHAVQHNKRIIPVVHRDAKEVPHTLTHLNWVFFRETEDFETAFQGLLRSIDTDLDWVKAHTRLTIRSVEWENHGRNDSYVLRGDDLKEAERRLAQTDKEPRLTSSQMQYIVASQQSAIRRQRRTLASIAFALLAVSILGCIAFLNFQASQREADLRLKAEAEAEEAGAARATAIAVQQTAEGQADVAVARAREAQAQALVAETSQAQALVAEATALAARENAETDRQAAVAAGETAQAAKAVAQTQQAQANAGLEGAVVAQQTAEAAQQEAVLAQQTALAGEQLAEASQATAVAGQATAQAQQATAVAGQATAQAQQAAAQAAAAQAAQAQAEAEAALKEAETALKAAEAAKQEAEAAQQEAEAAKAEAEADKAEAEAAKAEAEAAKAEAEAGLLAAVTAQAAAQADKATAQAQLAAIENRQVTVEAQLAEAQQLIDEAKQALLITRNTESCPFPVTNHDDRVALTYDGDHIWLLPRIGDPTGKLLKISAFNCDESEIITLNQPITNITYNQKFIWAVTSNNQLLKLDLSGTLLTTNSAGPPDSKPGALLFSRGRLWVASGGSNNLSQLDPATGTILESYPIGPDPSGLVDDGTYLWVIGGNFNNVINPTLNRIEPVTGETMMIPLSSDPTSVVYSQGYIWVSTYNGPLHKYEAATAQLVDTVEFDPISSSLVFDGLHLWLYNDYGDELIKLSPNKEAPLSAAGLGSPFSLRFSVASIFDGANLWVAITGLGSSGSNAGRLYKIPIHSYLVGQQPGYMVESGDYIWVRNYRGNSVSKIRAATGVQLETFPVGPQPIDLVVASDHLWVLNSGGGGSLSKLNQVDGQLLGPFPLGQAEPYDLAYDGTYVWVAYKEAVERFRESDGVSLGMKPLPSAAIRELLYDGTNIWSNDYNSLSKLSSDGSIIWTYPTSSIDHYVYDGTYFWGSLRAGADPNTVLLLTQIDPRVPPSGNFKIATFTLPIAAEATWGVAYENYLWMHHLRIPVANPLDTDNFATSICRAHSALYHQKTRSLWVSCSDDNAIQKIYGRVGPGVAGLAPPPAPLNQPASGLYLPLITKGKAPAAP